MTRGELLDRIRGQLRTLAIELINSEDESLATQVLEVQQDVVRLHSKFTSCALNDVDTRAGEQQADA